MKLFLTFLMTALCSVFISHTLPSRAFATIDSIGSFNYVYLLNIQEDPIYQGYESYLSNLSVDYSSLTSFCVGQSQFLDGISSSPYPTFLFMIQPFNIPLFPTVENEDGKVEVEYGNINLLSEPNLKIEFDYDSVTNYVEKTSSKYEYTYEPKLTIDISSFPKTTDDETFVSLIYAKLAILGVFANISSISSDFKAEINVIGLPDQTKFVTKDFSKVFGTTTYPYSSASPIIKAYKKELISEYCQ